MTDGATASGRLALTDRIASDSGRSLSVGAKHTQLADVNVDIEVAVEPDLVADATSLPFADGVFDTVYFTEVIEHLRPPADREALEEIYRVLSPTGELILSTPNDVRRYRVLDPSRLVMYHGAYSPSELEALLESVGFRVDRLFTAGGPFTCLSTLWYCLITYPLDRLGIAQGAVPNAIDRLRRTEFDGRSRADRGYTVFSRAIKNDV